MKKIHILTTGGTIAMTEDDRGHVQPVTNQNIDSVFPSLRKYAEVTMEEVFNLPSPHLTFPHLERLLSRVAQLMEEPDTDGIVITHGTDTLEETAYFLDLQLPPVKPVIVTGAMRSSNEIGSDGPLNLINSVRTAVCDDSTGQGVLVVFNDEIHGARYVTKTHTSSVATFQSPQIGPLGTLDKRSIQFRYSARKHENYGIQSLSQFSVGLVKMAIDVDSSLIDFMVDKGVSGLVIETLGQGNVPPKAVPGIKRATAQGIPVVLVSRCFNGMVQDVYGYEGGGKHLRELGAIFSNGLNGQKARIKLLVLLANGLPPDEIRSAFEN
ncbi:asparaginase [Effusibacillus lacus]|uniref:asparaginase n=1 Tax=Effusibacillus lacus TaxID=1348429 RepID=A0A292YMG5_9BACL|nr:asparaginase [Effusibacillus lacus]TCS75256.1 asparaginase [Effusibacillus lacus]GAX89695.1 L-asparaginase [Effusibacillus lacus]